MKKYIQIAIYFLFVFNLSFAQPTDILFSEYVEGSSNNKALELYNGTGNAIDLGAGTYIIEMYFNGSTSAGTTINLNGSVNIDDVYVLADNDADPQILLVADQTSTASFFNGDDAIVLKKGGASGTILDVIGQVGFDPGTEWGSGLISTADNTLRRKVGTTQGDTSRYNAFDPSVEWDGYAADTFSGLGFPDPLPVELSSFSAIILDNAIKLNWRTETEVSNYGFEIQRTDINPKSGIQNPQFEKIGFVNGHGNSNSPKNYSYLDDKITGGKYSYRLKQIDTDGKFEYSKVVEVDFDSPAKFELSQNYPNPFNPATTIKYSLPESGNVRLSIYNLLGEKIADLVNGFQEAGIHTINFNASGLNSGVYVYNIESNGIIQSRKMILVK